MMGTDLKFSTVNHPQTDGKDLSIIGEIFEALCDGEPEELDGVA